MQKRGIKQEENTNRCKPWFAEWFDENYLEIYRHRNAEEARQHIQLIIETLNLSKSKTILDLCCGEGRYTSILKDLGYRVLGLDLSKVMVKRAKKNDPELRLVIGDMRDIPGCFDLILSLFTSFGYFENDNENEQVIHSMYNALNPGGILWMDFFNSEYLETHLVSESYLSLSDSVEVLEKRKIENKRIIKDIFLIKDGMKKCDKYYRESVRLYSRSDLELMFQESGFRVIYSFGDYHGNAWSKSSERTILVGRKE